MVFIGGTMRYIPFLALFIGCAEAPVGLKDQSFSEFETWGQGIEGFNPVVSGPVDTGDAPSGFTQYDGAYFGTYQLAVSYEGNNCVSRSNTFVRSCDLISFDNFLNKANVSSASFSA